MLRKISIFLLLLFSFFNHLQAHANGNIKTIFGRVFYDENQNGIKNDFEKGIAGVKVKLSDHNFAITDENGDYSLSESFSILKSYLVLDDNSLPGGAVLTTESIYNISNQNQFVQERDFGIFYPKKEVDLIHNIPTKGFFLIVPSKLTIETFYDGSNLFIGEKKVLQTKNKKRLSKASLVKIKISDSKLNIQPESIEEINSFFKKNQLETQKVSIHIPKSFTDEDNHLIREVELQLLSLGINKQKVQKQLNSKYLNITLQVIKSSKEKVSHCSLDNGIEVKSLIPHKKQSFELNIKSSKTPFIQCGYQKQKIITPTLSLIGLKSGIIPLEGLQGNEEQKDTISLKIKLNQNLKMFLKGQQIKNGVITLPRKVSHSPLKIINIDGLEFAYPLEIKKSSIVSSNQSSPSTRFSISHSKYLHLSRDFSQSFEFKDPEMKIFYLNGRYITPKEEATTVILNSTRGYNKVEIKRDQKKYLYTYQIMEEPSVEARFRVGYYNSTAEVTEFGTTDTAKNVLRTDSYLKYFPSYKLKKDWGLGLRYSQDTDGVSIDLSNGETGIQKHTEIVFSLLKRVIFDPTDPNPLKYTFGVGTFKSSYENPENAKVFLPQDMSGLSAEVIILWERFGTEHLNLSTEIFTGLDISDTSNYILNLTGELSYNLNQLGKIFDTNSTFSHHDRYDYFKNFRLNLSLTYQNSERPVDNSSRGRIFENITMIQSGISWSY